MKKRSDAKKKHQFVSTQLTVPATSVNTVDSWSDDSIITSFISKKTEAEHNELTTRGEKRDFIYSQIFEV